MLGTHRASCARARDCRARACQVWARTLSEVIGSIGLSTKVTVKIGGWLHQSDRGYSTNLTVDNLMNRLALVCAELHQSDRGFW